jgi:hypothetical protein
MENSSTPEINERHTTNEFKNLWACQKIIRDWTHNPEWESYDVIPVLYNALHTGVKAYPGSANSPKLADVVRTTEAHLSGAPEGLLPDARHVYLLASKYTTKLDEILTKSPKTLEETISDAAFAYYVFDRIHPFPDGNGRVGRMIVKRIFKGAGLNDPIFHDQSWYGEGNSPHLDALDQVNETNNLASLEVFLAESLIGTYDPIKDFFKSRQLDKYIADAKKRAKAKDNTKLLEDIWDGFTGMNLYGNIPALKKD